MSENKFTGEEKTLNDLPKIKKSQDPCGIYLSIYLFQ